MTQSLAFPGPEPGDPEDVAWTLQTAGTMWSRGDSHEAVRWLRRAAEAAGDAGNDMRAVSLARAAADLTVALELPPSVLPPPVGPVVNVASPSPDQTHRMARPPVSRPENPAITPLDDSDRTETEYTIPNGMRFDAPRSPPPPPSRTGAPPPPRSRPSGRPPPPRSPSSAPTRSSPSGMPEPPPPSRPPPSRSSPSAAPPPVQNPGPPQSRASTPPTRSSPAAHTHQSTSALAHAAGLPAFRPRQALRVAVTPSPDDKSLLLARLLADDEALPDGAHEALLTALEPGAHLTSKKR